MIKESLFDLTVKVALVTGSVIAMDGGHVINPLQKLLYSTTLIKFPVLSFPSG